MPGGGIDLTSCEREPIHVPGSIQPRGVLLACDEQGIVRYVSENAPSLLTCTTAADVLGQPLESLLGPTISRRIAKSLADLAPGGEVARPRQFDVRLRGRSERVNIIAHRNAGPPQAGRVKADAGPPQAGRVKTDADPQQAGSLTIVELEPVCAHSGEPPLDVVRGILARLQETRTLRQLCDATVEEIARLLGFARVMIYRFAPDGTGHVLAEARDPSLTPLLGLRYPASDVPPPARALYRKNWVRLIDEVGAPPARILSSSADAEAIDLTYSDLRSVSPVHVEYLTNMGVAASMSISIIVGGELWGLIACHHDGAPAKVDASVRAAAELLGQVFSLQIQTMESTEAYVTMRAGRMLLDRVLAELPIGEDMVTNLAARLDQLAAFLHCDGAAIFVEGSFRGMGVVPTVGEIAALCRFLAHESTGGVYATDHLAAGFDIASFWSCGICGVLAVPLSSEPGSWLLFFRKAMVHTVEWGGDPNKLLSVGDDGKISPRRSFDVWKAEVRDRSMPWSSRERLLGDTLRVYLLDVLVRFGDVLREERKRADQARRLLRSELNHRVRGTLDLIQSLVAHGYSESGGLRDFVRSLQGRVEAIALAHEATSVADSSDLRSLFERSFALHPPSPAALTLNGSDVRLRARAYTVAALVVHELVASAARRGVLGSPAGQLAARWYVDDLRRLVILWEDRGGTGASSAALDPLGLAILERNIPHALGGEAEVRVVDGGVRATFVLPEHAIVHDDDSGPRLLEAAHEAEATPRRLASAPRPLEGINVLVIEAQMPAAIELERVVRERGAATVRLAGTLEAALAAISAEPPDVALVDYDLGEGAAKTIADALVAASTPFVLAVSARDATNLPPRFYDVGRVAKPYAMDSVVDLLKEAVLSSLIRAVLGKLS
ncbi:MAG: GAF domain-containing protein [Deltaproteobacteria bacterium]|nr:GAF domain-containing protein [Deltaproteobacteria bacterium]